MISVANIQHIDRRDNRHVYVGRDRIWFGPSKLRNIYNIPHHGNRDQVIQRYRYHLYSILKFGMYGEIPQDRIWNNREYQSAFNEFVRIAEASKHQDIILVCHCYPMPCHADRIKGAIEWYLKQ